MDLFRVSACFLVCLLQACDHLLGKTDLFALLFSFVFVTFPCGVLGQVWYLIVSIPDLCHLTYSVCPLGALAVRVS